MPTKIRVVKAMVFPVVMYGCRSWTIKKAEHRRTKALELWCWRRLLRVPWTVRRSNKSILKKINPKYLSEELMLKLKLLIWWPPDTKSWLTGKDPDAGKDWRQEKWLTEHEISGWHHRLNQCESEQMPGDSEGQGSLVCCSPLGCKELDTTWQLNNNKYVYVSCWTYFLFHRLIYLFCNNATHIALDL